MITLTSSESTAIYIAFLIFKITLLQSLFRGETMLSSIHLVIIHPTASLGRLTCGLTINGQLQLHTT